MIPAESAQTAASAAGIGGKREALPVWPADSVPNAAEAERAVAAVLDGTAGGLGPEIVARIKSDLTDVERAAFAGDAPEDLRAFRVAAALRWRLAAAVLTAPRTGRFDAAAVAALLADTDAVLADVDRAGAGAPEEVATAPVRPLDGAEIEGRVASRHEGGGGVRPARGHAEVPAGVATASGENGAGGGQRHPFWLRRHVRHSTRM